MQGKLRVHAKLKPMPSSCLLVETIFVRVALLSWVRIRRRLIMGLVRKQITGALALRSNQSCGHITLLVTIIVRNACARQEGETVRAQVKWYALLWCAGQSGRFKGTLGLAGVHAWAAWALLTHQRYLPLFQWTQSSHCTKSSRQDASLLPNLHV